MRNSTIVTLLNVMTCLCGCSTDESPSASNAPAASNEAPAQLPAHTLSTEEDAPDFDPRLSLKWPGTPEETRRRINAGQPDESTTFRASLIQSDPATIFSATVSHFTEKDRQGIDLNEMLADSALQSDEELSRKEIKHGPNKYPGLDVTAKSGTSFVRRIVVLAETRFYQIEVMSTKKERLEAEDITTFFESFAVTQ